MTSRAIIEAWLLQWALFDVGYLAEIIRQVIKPHHFQDRHNFAFYRALLMSKWDIHKAMAFIRQEYVAPWRSIWLDHFLGIPILDEPDLNEMLRLLEHGKQNELDAVAQPLWDELAAPDLKGREADGHHRKVC